MTDELSALKLNPFEDDAVREPRAVTYSVVGLNDEPLDQLISKFDRLTLGKLPRPPAVAGHAQLVVSPDAGYGKSHLLGRLFQKLGDRATQIYLRPFQNPERAWNSILLTTVRELGLPDQHANQSQTQLEVFAKGVIAHVTADFITEEGMAADPQVQKAVDHLRDFPLPMLGAVTRNGGLIDWIMKRLDRQSDLNRLATLLNRRGVHLDGREGAWLKVLSSYGFAHDGSVERAAALSWLRAEPLEEDDARALKLRPADNDGRADATAREINDLSLSRLRGLCALSSYYRPFLFCFDQTEFFSGDMALIDVLGSCIWELHAALPNHMTVVTTNQTNWIDEIRPHLRKQYQDRFSAPITLEGINREQAKALITKRLTDFQIGNLTVAKFIEPRWLAAQFEQQAQIGVRYILVRASERFRVLAKVPSARIKTSMQDVFDSEVNKMRAKPALHQYNQDCLMWLAQVLVEGFDGVAVRKPRNKYFSTQWEWKDRSVYFAFESGDNNARWRAIANEAVTLTAAGRRCAVVFRTPDLKPIPGLRWVAARQSIEQACQKGLRIVRLDIDEVCELHAAREFYSNARQGNVEFAPADVLAWLKKRFVPWFEKYASVEVDDAPPPPKPPTRSPPPKAATKPAPSNPAILLGVPLAKLTESQMKRAVSHVKERKLVDIQEVLDELGSPVFKEPLLLEVERHPNLKAHAGPQTIYLQWRIV